MNIGHWLHRINGHQYGEYDQRYYDDQRKLKGSKITNDFDFRVSVCGDDWCDNIKTTLEIHNPDKIYEITQQCHELINETLAKKKVWKDKLKKEDEAKKAIEKNYRSFKPEGIG